MNVHTLLNNADIALNRVKGSGRNTYSFYTATIPSPQSNTLAPGARKSLELCLEGECLLYYQLSSIRRKQVALLVFKLSYDGILLN